MVDGVDEVRGDSCETLAEVADVAGVWLGREKLIDDREEIVEGGEACQRCRAVGSLGSSGGGEQECGVGDLERDLAIEESGCEAAVGASGEAGRAGCASVETDHLLDVALSRGHSGLRLWRARPQQRLVPWPWVEAFGRTPRSRVCDRSGGARGAPPWRAARWPWWRGRAGCRPRVRRVWSSPRVS